MIKINKISYTSVEDAKEFLLSCIRETDGVEKSRYMAAYVAVDNGQTEIDILNILDGELEPELPKVQRYTFAIKRKCVIDEKSTFNITADSYEKAESMAKMFLRSQVCTEFTTDDSSVDLYMAEFQPESQKYMKPEENNGEPTAYLYFYTGKDIKFIDDNKCPIKQ